MTLIEQAVFTSARTDRSAGYQVVAASPGMSESEVRELALWGPSHDSLLMRGAEAVSFNFHPLASGTFCVSRTTRAGREYSNRGSSRIYTQCLVVPPETLARFANNPFAVLKAALAAGVLEAHQPVPKRLEPVRLTGRTAAVDATLLTRLSNSPGPDWMATLVQAVLGAKNLALSGAADVGCLIAGLLNCLPPECRTEFSFSTGLKYASHRPFRIVSLPEDPTTQRRAKHRHNLTVLDVRGEPPAEFAPIDGWARFIRRVLLAGRTSFLAMQLSKRRRELVTTDLPALGLQLLEELDASSLPDEGDNTPVRRSARDNWLTTLQHAHAPHPRLPAGSAATVSQRPPAAAPDEQADPARPNLSETLELLDDLVYGAIGGGPTALEQLRTRWPEIRDALGHPLLTESRQQYLRHALSIWEECVELDGVRNPAGAVRALDVLCVLFDED